MEKFFFFQPTFKYDISTDAYSQPEGASENRFEIKPDVEKLFRKKPHNSAIFKPILKFGALFDVLTGGAV